MNKNNTSYFNHKLNKIFWRIDWTFYDTDLTYSDHKYLFLNFFKINYYYISYKKCFTPRVPEYQKLNDLARKYFTTEFHDDQANEKMQFYVSSGIKDVLFLMKTPYGKYE